MLIGFHYWLIRCLAVLILVAQVSAPLSAFSPQLIEICSGHGIRVIAVAPDPADLAERPCAHCIAHCAASLVEPGLADFHALTPQAAHLGYGLARPSISASYRSARARDPPGSLV